jgi:hypothetical protein
LETATLVLEKKRSTCLMACFPLSSFATARARPSAPTASWAPCRAPTVASASDTTRLAWRSWSKIEETKSCTRRGRMARVRMARHDDFNPAGRLQLRTSHDRGDEGIGQTGSSNNAGIGGAQNSADSVSAVSVNAHLCPPLPILVPW